MKLQHCKTYKVFAVLHCWIPRSTNWHTPVMAEKTNHTKKWKIGIYCIMIMLIVAVNLEVIKEQVSFKTN